jgi:exopolysaccharide biosynthesis WecB/TagA/CpsF family protein
MTMHIEVDNLHDAMPVGARSFAALSRMLYSPLAQTLYRDGSVDLFGLSLANLDCRRAAQHIVNAAAYGTRGTIHFINAHCIDTMLRDADYQHCLSEADGLLPDGSGLRLAAWLAAQPSPENCNGTDLFPELCAAAAAAGIPIFLLGGQEGIAEQTARTMQSRFPLLRIAGSASGYFAAEDEAALIERINASGAAILLVGMGVPQQEKWLASHRDVLNPAIAMGVGGLFDYYSGRIPRAPAWLRRSGLEWTWRLACEPRRLAKRYLFGNARFCWQALGHGIRARGWSNALSAGIKRLFDFTAALAALLFFLPLFLFVSAAIMIEDRGAPFFFQTRIGHRGKPFRMWKFRSMYRDAEARKAALAVLNERDSVCFKMKQDPRVTKVGRFIRRSSIDELPQLVNILLGQMSIVGPRPALPNEVLTYARREQGRLGGKPGLTCVWQVSGRADIPFDQQVDMDIGYLNNRTLLQDLWLIARTVPAILSGRGAY